MNKIAGKTANRFLRLLPLLIIALHLLSTNAGAADSASDWRSVYDVIMLWVNFFILVFIIYYYGRKPIKNFLQGKQDEVSDKIDQLEERKNNFERQIQETRQMIQDSSVRFEEIKSRITEQGKRKRQEIIDQANEQSRKLLEMEKKKAGNQILQARYRLMNELADMAGDMASRQLPAEITAADQENMLSAYLNQIAEYAQKSG